MTMYTRNDSRSEPASVIDCALDRDALFTPQIAPLALPDGTVPVDNDGGISLLS